MKAKLNNQNEIRLIIGKDYIVDIQSVNGAIHHDIQTPNGAIQLASNLNESIQAVLNKIETAIEKYEAQQQGEI